MEGATADMGFGAFLADLSLDVRVLWNGTIRVTFDQGQVKGLPAEAADAGEGLSTLEQFAIELSGKNKNVSIFVYVKW